MTKNHETPVGILGEPVQFRDEFLRRFYRSPGHVVGTRHTVEVEFSDRDGPHVITVDIHDLERPFPRDCEATAHRDDATYICGMPVNYRGECPVADRHVKEDK